MKLLLTLILLALTVVPAHSQGALTPYAPLQFFNASGLPASLGKLCTYAAGSSTPTAVYTNSALTVAHANPISLNSVGRISGSSGLYLSPVSYKFVLHAAGTGSTCNGTAVGTALWTLDNVYDYGQLLATGVFEFTEINNRIFCTQGASAGAKISAAITALPATGGTVDCTNLEGAQTISANPFTGVTKPVNLLLGAATYTLSSSSTVPSNVTVDIGRGGSVSVNTGIVLTVDGEISAGAYQIFSGAGTSSFSANARQKEVLVEWWGAVADYNYPTGTDNGPPICKALNSGARHIRHAGGIYGVTTACTITGTGFTWEGGSYVDTSIAPLALSYSPINAMFINAQNVLNSTITRLRFANFGQAFTGSAFYSEEGGGTQSFFSTTFAFNWFSMGAASTAAITGDIVDSYLTNNTFELGTTGLNMTGPYFTGTTLSGNIWGNNSAFFIYSLGGSNLINVSDTIFYGQQANALIHTESAGRWTITGMSGDTAVANAAQTILFDMRNCVQCVISGVAANNPTGTGNMKVANLVSSDIRFSNSKFLDAGSTGTTVFTISGTASNVEVSNVEFKSSSVAEIGVSGTGDIKLTGVKSTEAASYFIRPDSPGSYNLTLQGSEIVNAGFTTAVPFISLESSGRFAIVDNQFTYTSGSANGFLLAVGSGTGAMVSGNIFTGADASHPVQVAGTTQAVRYGPNKGLATIYYADTMPATGAWSIGDLVIDGSPTAATAFGWARLTTSANNVLGTDWLALWPVSNAVYGAGWNGSLLGTSQDAVYDHIQGLVGAGATVTLSCGAGQAIKTLTVVNGIVTAATCGVP